MNIYHVEDTISPDKNKFVSHVCVAENEQEARGMFPRNRHMVIRDGDWWFQNSLGSVKDVGAATSIWVPAHRVHLLKVTHLGTAAPDIPKGTVMAARL